MVVVCLRVFDSRVKNFDFVTVNNLDRAHIPYWKLIVVKVSFGVAKETIAPTNAAACPFGFLTTAAANRTLSYSAQL